MKKKKEGTKEEKKEEKKETQSEMPNFRGMFEGAQLTNCTQNFIWGNETVHVHSDNKKDEDDVEQDAPKELTKEQMARAIENCQEFIWANSAYAVLFCILRDDYKQKDLSMATYERMVELLPYKITRKHTCPAGTIANAFSDNAIFNSPTDKWDEMNASQRIIKLRDALRKELKK